MKVTLVEFDENLLECSWKWLNDSEIREMISASNLITKEGQLKWFNSISALDDYCIWGISVENIPIGACGIKNITNFDCEYWGYIGEKKYWGKGLGRQIMILMENEARNRNLKIIWLQVNKNNNRAINLYRKMKYQIKEIIDGSLIMHKVL